MRVLTYVLLSGGIDSAACLHYYRELGRDLRALFADYGQAASDLEQRSARAVAAHYGVLLDEIAVSGPRTFADGEIRGRNAFLLLTALMWCPQDTAITATGLHSGTPYYDCTENFLNTINALLDGYTDGTIRCEAPFLHWEKSAIWEYCRLKEVPIHLTYSCEAGTEPPCGRCLSCRDRSALHAAGTS